MCIVLVSRSGRHGAHLRCLQVFVSRSGRHCSHLRPQDLHGVRIPLGAALCLSLTARDARCSYPARGGTLLILDFLVGSVFVSRSGRHWAHVVARSVGLGTNGTRFCPGSLPRAGNSVTVCHDVVGLAGRTDSARQRRRSLARRIRTSTGIAVARTLVTHDSNLKTNVNIDFAVVLMSLPETGRQR